MERSAAQVIHQVRNIFHQVATGCRMVLWIVLGIALFMPAQSQNKAEYLLVEHPESLHIYNSYQQRISQEEKNFFVPFIPLKILNHQIVMNDNFTTCMEVEVKGKRFFLLLSEDKILSGLEKTNSYRFTPSIPMEEDTVTLKTNCLFQSPSKHHGSSILRKGNQVVRFFTEKNLTYINLLGPKTTYGWADLSNKETYVIARRERRPVELSNQLSSTIVQQMERVISESNHVIRILFSYYEKKKENKTPMPQWRLVKKDLFYHCVVEPNSFVQKYPKSTECLVDEFNLILENTTYEAIVTSGHIIVRNRL
jgi:hypothetical protein